MDTYAFDWIPGPSVLQRTEMVEEMCQLYSAHYGTWAKADPGGRGGANIRLSRSRMEACLNHEEVKVAFARHNGQIVGYCIVVQAHAPRKGMVSWVTQLVVHEAHRTRDIGKRLLYSMWSYSDHYAWGLLTANPYAVRALEKATRHRCSLNVIKKQQASILTFGRKHVPYFNQDTEIKINARTSATNTRFFVDHTQLPTMLLDVTTSEVPWTLGGLEEGWEWFAFTFHDQPPISLSQKEVHEMLSTSDQITKRAYGRMQLSTPSQVWARFTENEIRIILECVGESTRPDFLDLGCGNGRHALALTAKGYEVDAVDYAIHHIQAAVKAHPPSLRIIQGDARAIDMGRTYDMALCLYDVIGTYADNTENQKILNNLSRHLRSGGHALISVMNYQFTLHRAKSTFRLSESSEPLMDLSPSTAMETTGDVFDPDHFLLDTETQVVYRKEQFSVDQELPQELLVRDRRFTKDEIETMCQSAGLEVIWSRYVRAGRWELDAGPTNGKEILVFCRKP